MVTKTCPVRLRAWSKPDGIFDCRKPADHDDGRHDANGLYPGQTITWYEGDRRSFTGPFVNCDESSCLLPAGHHGDHAS